MLRRPAVLGVVLVDPASPVGGWLLDGTPLVAWAQAALASSGCVDEIRETSLDRPDALLGALGDIADDAVVLVHDVLHPLVTPELVGAVVAAVAGGEPGAVAVRPVTDTLKRVDGDDVIIGTADRQRYRVVCSPWACRAGVLREAGAGPGLPERVRGLVTVPAPQEVFRVEGPDDLGLAEAVLAGLRASGDRARPGSVPPGPGRTGR